MINRLVYEVRLKELKKEHRTKNHKRWRWDVIFYLTTDPEFPGVETGRVEVYGPKWGYERSKRKALNNIADAILNNPLKKDIPER